MTDEVTFSRAARAPNLCVAQLEPVGQHGENHRHDVDGASTTPWARTANPMESFPHPHHPMARRPTASRTHDQQGRQQVRDSQPLDLQQQEANSHDQQSAGGGEVRAGPRAPAGNRAVRRAASAPPAPPAPSGRRTPRRCPGWPRRRPTPRRRAWPWCSGSPLRPHPFLMEPTMVIGPTQNTRLAVTKPGRMSRSRLRPGLEPLPRPLQRGFQVEPLAQIPPSTMPAMTTRRFPALSAICAPMSSVHKPSPVVMIPWRRSGSRPLPPSRWRSPGGPRLHSPASRA